MKPAPRASTPTPNKPAYEVFTVLERGEGKKNFWLKVGAVWPNKDGTSYSLNLDAMPLNGRLQLRLPYEDEGK